MSKKKTDEGYKIEICYTFSDKVMPAELRLIEREMGELLQQVIRETNQEE